MALLDPQGLKAMEEHKEIQVILATRGQMDTLVPQATQDHLGQREKQAQMEAMERRGIQGAQVPPDEIQLSQGQPEIQDQRAPIRRSRDPQVGLDQLP
jgi:hypothetical protein